MHVITKIAIGLAVALVITIVIAWVVVTLGFAPGGIRNQPKPIAAAATPAIQPAPRTAPKRSHQYVMNDGLQYGYEPIVSDAARQSGQVAASLVMVYYAGERGGRHQAHLINGDHVQALECEIPCEYVKIMILTDQPELRRQVSVERIRNHPGSIMWAIMDDAANGRLRPYGREINGKPHSVWVDERRGLQYTLFDKLTASASNPIK